MKYPIIDSLLDTDWYKFTMGQFFFYNLPNARAKYKFYTRNNRPYPKGFAERLKEQLISLSNVTLTDGEYQYLQGQPRMLSSYLDWLRHYRFDCNEVNIHQKGGALDISISGLLYRTTYWEVPLMAIISELLTMEADNDKIDDHWTDNIKLKGELLSRHNCEWMDFSTRRRASYVTQLEVVRKHKNYNGFLGTSNPYLAMQHNMSPMGTYAHELIMAVTPLVGVEHANIYAIQHWREMYGSDKTISLTDTYTTDVFFRDFDAETAATVAGLRQDSNDPYEWGCNALNRYTRLNVDAHHKKFVFSNGLDPNTYIPIHNQFHPYCRPIAGIGTNLSNDIGLEPPNIVIKLDAVDYNDGNGYHPVVKLSDDIGKHTGDKKEVKRIKTILNINH